MNKKDKYLEQYFEKKKNNLSFITIKKGAIIKFKDKEFVAKEEFPVPIRIDNLIDDIKKQQIDNIEGIKLGNIIDGIIYMRGTDETFEYYSIYDEMLSSLSFDICPYIILCINELEDEKNKTNEQKKDDAIIFGKALLNIKEDEKSCFIYASTLENKAISMNEKNDKSDKTDENIQKEIISQYFLEEAHKYYEEALNFNEKFPLSYYKLGYFYKFRQQYVKAEAFWKKHLEIDDDTLRIDEIRNELIQIKPYVDYENGYNLVLKEQPNEALELLLPLVKIFDNWWNLLFFIGLAYRQLGEYKIAETYFENVLKIDHMQKEALNELGLCKICRGKYVEAEELFTKLLNIEPGTCEIFCNRAVTYLYNQQLDRALEDINTALKIDPSDEIAKSIKKQIEMEYKNK